MMIKQIFSEQFVDWYIGFNVLLRPLSVRIPPSVFCQEPIRNFDMFSDGQVRMKDHVLVSKFQIFDHPLADVLD